MTNILPTFYTGSFDFGETDIPEHIEGLPVFELRSIGMFALIGAGDGKQLYTLAIDVPDLGTAELLANARVRIKEATIETYLYTDDVYVIDPSNNEARYYTGRKIEDEQDDN